MSKKEEEYRKSTPPLKKQTCSCKKTCRSVIIFSLVQVVEKSQTNRK